MHSTACDDVIVTEVSVETNPVSSLPLRQLNHLWKMWGFCGSLLVVGAVTLRPVYWCDRAFL